jgi:hypothetical protein
MLADDSHPAGGRAARPAGPSTSARDDAAGSDRAETLGEQRVTAVRPSNGSPERTGQSPREGCV